VKNLENNVSQSVVSGLQVFDKNVLEPNLRLSEAL